MTYFLGANAAIALLKDRPAGVRKRLRRALSRGSSVALSSVALYDLWYGVVERSEFARVRGLAWQDWTAGA